MKKKLLTLAMLSIASTTQANVIQYFTGISYSNPAELFKTKGTSFLIGGTYMDPDLRFRGTSRDLLTGAYPYGEVHSTKNSLLPYARIAKRVSPKLVIGVDVTQPFHSNLNWGTDAFTNYAATQNYLYDFDISPRFSAALSEQLFFGFGFNLNYLYKNEANWAVPDTVNGTYHNLINKSSNLGIGFNAGLFYILNPQNMFGITYYSKVYQPTTGTSYWGGAANNSYAFGFNMPATTILDYTHFFNKKWLVNTKFFYSQWSMNQSVTYYNTSAPANVGGPNITFPLEFKNSWALLFATHYQYNDKLGLLAFAMFDQGPEKDNLRPLIFPSDNIYFAGFGIDYKISKKTTVELMYGHGYEATTLNNTIPTASGGVAPFSRGNININADVIDLKFKVEV